MSWTYDADFSLARDQVRFHVGDTDTSDQLVQDEEIAYVLTTHDETAVGVLKTAATICESLATKFARDVDASVEGVSISSSQRSKAFAERAAKLRSEVKRQAVLGAQPFAGGISKSDKDRVEQDDDRIDADFQRGMHDYQGTKTDDQLIGEGY